GPVRSAIMPSFIVAGAAWVEPPDPVDPDELLHAARPVASSATATAATWARLGFRKVLLVFNMVRPPLPVDERARPGTFVISCASPVSVLAPVVDESQSAVVSALSPR